MSLSLTKIEGGYGIISMISSKAWADSCAVLVVSFFVYAILENASMTTSIYLNPRF